MLALQPRASGVSIWLTGALPEAFDRFKAAHVSIDDDLQSINSENQNVANKPPDWLSNIRLLLADLTREAGPSATLLA